jgi:ATP-dependent helicase YprA (DUF1998 family)
MFRLRLTNAVRLTRPSLRTPLRSTSSVMRTPDTAPETFENPPPNSILADNDARVQAFLKEHQIVLKGLNLEENAPLLDFETTPFSAKIKKALKNQGFTSPTPIQSVSWTLALNKRDMIAVAKTGSGKTCGFLLPALHMLESNATSTATTAPTGARYSRSSVSSYRAPSVLVLAPTRELAVQIEKESVKFTSATGTVSFSMFSHGYTPFASSLVAFRRPDHRLSVRWILARNANRFTAPRGRHRHRDAGQV